MNLRGKTSSVSSKVRRAQIEICILAGGQSSRMGRDKSKLRIGGKPLVTHIRNTAKALPFPVRIVRRDLVPQCGPMGGIYTALKTTDADIVLFLACDMPQLSEQLLNDLCARIKPKTNAIFTWNNGSFGFPFCVSQSALPIVEKLLSEKQFSLQNLARKTRAQKFRPRPELKENLLNVNTPEDWIELQKKFLKKN
jgi:molybdenum cofactor guanylyltransferase